MKNKTEVEKIIEKSGNVFHSRVAKFLRKEGWTILVSAYYSDNFTDKPREIDLIAEKESEANFIGTRYGTIDTRLFIECKYINTPIVFWFDNKDKERTIDRTMSDTGMAHPSRNVNINGHHYFSDLLVAKLFSSGKDRSEENEIMSKAINQNLNATIYYRPRPIITFPKNFNQHNQTLRFLNYPVIVVNSFDNFYRINMNDEEEKVEKITDPFQLEISYAYKTGDGNGYNEYFLIDVVSFDKLPQFLSTINQDIKIVSENSAVDEYNKKKKSGTS